MASHKESLEQVRMPCSMPLLPIPPWKRVPLIRHRDRPKENWNDGYNHLLTDHFHSFYIVILCVKVRMVWHCIVPASSNRESYLLSINTTVDLKGRFTWGVRGWVWGMVLQSGPKIKHFSKIHCTALTTCILRRIAALERGMTEHEIDALRLH